MSAPFPFQPIIRTCLALNGRTRITFSDDRDPRPLARLFIPQTAVSVLLTETHPEDADQAYGLIDEGHGTPRIGFISLAEMKDRGADLDPLFKGDYPLSHYAGVAEIAGRIVTKR